MSKVSTEIKKLVFQDPDMTSEAIVFALTQAGISSTLGSVSAYRSDFLNSLALLNELGAFNNAAPVPTKKAKKAKRPSRSTRWADACARASEALGELQDLQQEYSDWKDNLPESLQSSPVGEKLDAVCELDIEGAMSTVEEADGADLPQGFGRD